MVAGLGVVAALGWLGTGVLAVDLAVVVAGLGEAVVLGAGVDPLAVELALSWSLVPVLTRLGSSMPLSETRLARDTP